VKFIDAHSVSKMPNPRCMKGGAWSFGLACWK